MKQTNNGCDFQNAPPEECLEEAQEAVRGFDLSKVRHPYRQNLPGVMMPICTSRKGRTEYIRADHVIHVAGYLHRDYEEHVREEDGVTVGDHVETLGCRIYLAGGTTKGIPCYEKTRVIIDRVEETLRGIVQA